MMIMRRSCFSVILIVFMQALSFAADSPVWKIIPGRGIVWDVSDGGTPHSDHIEMSGEYMSAVLRWNIDSQKTLSFERSLVFPMLRTLPNDTHASLMFRNSLDIPSLLSVDGLSLKAGRTLQVEINGMFKSQETWCVGKHNIGTGAGTDPFPAVAIERTAFPSMDKPVYCEMYKVTNLKESSVVLYVPEFEHKVKTLSDKGVDGSYVIHATIDHAGTILLDKGETFCFSVTFQAYKESGAPLAVDVESELDSRMRFIGHDVDSELILVTPDTVVNTMFRFAKLRTSESIFKTSGGYMHAPGGESYYAAIWSNDQAEYVNPFFPFLGYWKGNESALNAFRHFARFMNPEYEPIPSSIIAEGTDVWCGAGDRGDAAMIAYGAGRYLLARGDRAEAEELWPLVEWCLEYCRRKLTADGVVASDTDELEGRFDAGEANLSTSCLYYDALLSAAYLAGELGFSAERQKSYIEQAERLSASIEHFFGKRISGYRTYRYYEGNEVLRSWICMPLCVGIMDRAQETADALLGPEMWTGNGLLTEEGDSVYWDRATLYALRGVFCTGNSDIAIKKLSDYSKTRLLGDHVPYAIEAYPEGSQRHLAAESGLYCRVITEGLFGIRPTGFDSFDISPSMPSGWDKMSLHRINAFGRIFDIDIERVDEDVKIQISSGGTNVEYVVAQGESLHIDLTESLSEPASVDVLSPDGKIKMTVEAENALSYSVVYESDTLVSPSKISMSFAGGPVIGKRPIIKYLTRTFGSESINTPFYRQSEVKGEWNEVAIEFEDDYILRCRAYDSGVAWRFETDFPIDSVTVSGEVAEFLFPHDNMSWVGYSVGQDPFANAYQNEYSYERTSDFGKESELAFLPLATDCGNGLKMLICESDLRSYPGMFLTGTAGGYKGCFAGLPDSTYIHPLRNQLKIASRKDVIAETDGSRTYPWRILAISKEDKDLPVNDLVYLLAEPARNEDMTWIRPGQAAWEWWNHYGIVSEGFTPGINDETYKAYIDFASEMGIPYMIIDEGWSAKDDIMKVCDALNIEELVSYASDKGVGIILWAVANVLEEKLEEACAYYSALGVKGFKVDFFDRDDQEAVDMVYDIASATSEYNLVLDLHGIYKPTGLNRTFPHIINFESVFGLEELKWSNPDMPEYDVTFPFIRQVQGPVDYTQGAFHNSSENDFRIDYYNPMSQGTRAHQVAEYIVFDSPLAMLCDSPSKYRDDLECVKFITEIPTVFDRTSIIAGEIGEYIVTAREKDGIWYVGALTDWDRRTVEVPFDFLDPGEEYNVLMLSDTEESSSSPQKYEISGFEIVAGESLRLNLAPGGGAAMIILKKNTKSLL